MSKFKNALFVTLSVMVLLAFTIPTVALANANENLALGKVVTETSYADYGNNIDYSGSAAVDGDGSTFWLVDGPLFPASIVVDLGQEYALSKFVQTFTGDGIPDVKFIVQGSVDGSSYTTLHTTDNTDKDITLKTIEGAIEGTYRYVRLTMQGGIGWPNSAEFEVYGSQPAAPAPTANPQTSDVGYLTYVLMMLTAGFGLVAFRSMRRFNLTK